MFIRDGAGVICLCGGGELSVCALAFLSSDSRIPWLEAEAEMGPISCGNRRVASEGSYLTALKHTEPFR